MLDEKEVGQIADGETSEYDIAPGEHILYMKIDYARSEKIQFTVDAGKNIEFVCSPNITGLKILVSFLYLTILCTRYVRLEQSY